LKKTDLIFIWTRKQKTAGRQTAEPIEMKAKRFGYFPRTFMRRGHEYQVEGIIRCWTTGSRSNGGRMQRHHFEVRCAEGIMEVWQDLQNNTWHLSAGPKAEG